MHSRPVNFIRPIIAALVLAGCAMDTGEVGSSTEAIMGGTIDTTDQYPEVGQVGLYFPSGSGRLPPGRFSAVCSGVLVDRDRVISTSECLFHTPSLLEQISGAPLASDARWAVVFDRTVERVHFNQQDGHTGTLVLNDYEVGNVDDFAVLQLDSPVEHIEPAELAPLGFLESLTRGNGNAANALDFVTVGYGFDHIDGERPNTRQIGHQALLSLNDRGQARFNSDLSQGYNSICGGDKGGPIFLADTHMIVALNDETLDEGFADCLGPENLHQRIDIAAACEFLSTYGVSYPGPCNRGR